MYATDYLTPMAYGGEIYNILLEDITTNTAHNTAYYVKTFLTSSSINDIYDSAKDAGFSKIQIVRATYVVALQYDPRNEVIIQGIHDYIYDYNWWYKVFYYAKLSGLGLSTLVTLFSLGFYIVYFKCDRRVLLRYISSYMGFHNEKVGK
jgi:hypothetical protein